MRIENGELRMEDGELGGWRMEDLLIENAKFEIGGPEKYQCKKENG